MAIIYTYPKKTNPNNLDLVLISDSEDNNQTKQVTIADIKGATASGVSSIIAGTNITIDPVSGTGNVTINASSGSGTVTSVGLTMPSAFSVANSPITTSGTLNVTTTGGSAGEYLDSTGNWSTPPTGGSPGGSDTQMQYNNGGSFGGTTGLTWDDSTNILSIATR